MKNMLRDFDELHVVNFDEPGGSGSGAGVGGAGFTIPDIEYANDLSVLSEKFEQLKNKLKEVLPFLGILAAILGIIYFGDIINGIKNFLVALSQNNPIILFVAGAALMIKGLLDFHDAIHKILAGDFSIDTLNDALDALSWMALGSAGILLALTKGAILTTFGFSGLLVGAILLTLGIAAAYIIFDQFKELLFGTNDTFETFRNIMIGVAVAAGVATVAGILFNLAWAPIVLTILLVITVIATVIAAIKELGKIFNWWGDETEKSNDKVKTSTESAFSSINSLLENGTTDVNSFSDAFSGSIGTTNTNLDDLSKKLEETFGKDTSSMLNSSIGNYENYSSELSKITGEINSGTSKDLKELQTNFDTSSKDILDTGTTTFQDLAKTIDTSTKDAFIAFNNNMQDILDTLDADALIIADYANEIKTALKSIGETQIKIPHFRIDWDTWSTNGKFMQKAGLPGFPMIAVDWYMNGGFPTKGDLFIANEREPELIGSMGNRSVVANNTQITEGIADASYYGMRKALKEVDFGGDTEIYIGNRQITDYVVKQKKMDDRRYGR